MNEPDDTPIIVNPSPIADQTGAIVRDLMLVLSALPTLMAVIGTHDVLKVIAYLQSAAFAPVLGVIVTAGIMLWRQWNTRRRKAVLVTAAAAAPDSVAKVL